MNLRRLSAPINRGIVLDLVIFAFNLALVRVLGVLANNLLHAAVEDVRAKLVIGLFFAVLVLIQPLGPVLRRWSYHQRHTFDTESGAGCLLLYFMFVYYVMMMSLCCAAVVIIGEVFSTGEGVGVSLILGGFVWSITSVVLVYRYFVSPKKPPRWTFLTTPAAERLGDVCIFINAIGLQILWSAVTASAAFTELVMRTPLGRPGHVTDILGRFAATAICAVILYVPGRIFYLVEDKHRPLTYATMVLANLPLILRIAFTPAG